MQTIDRFLMSRIFGPIAIAIMRRLGLSKYSLHSHAWFIAALFLLYGIVNSGITGALRWIVIFLTIIFTGSVMLRAALAPDTPAYSNYTMRVIWIVILFIDLLFSIPQLPHVAIEKLLADIFILLAEYSLLIDKIPPKKVKEKKQKMVTKLA